MLLPDSLMCTNIDLNYLKAERIPAYSLSLYSQDAELSHNPYFHIHSMIKFAKIKAGKTIGPLIEHFIAQLLYTTDVDFLFGFHRKEIQ